MLSTTISTTQIKSPKEQHSTNLNVVTSDKAEKLTCDVAVNTELNWNTKISKKLTLHTGTQENRVIHQTGLLTQQAGVEP